MTASTHTLTAALVSPATALTPQEATTTLDDSWAPYVQVDMVCAMPTADDLILIDPRAGRRVQLVATADFGTWNDVPIPGSTRSFNLGLRSRTVDRAAGTMHLTLASDEALLQDYLLIATAPYTPGTTSVRALAVYVLGLIGATLTAGSDDGTILAASSTWTPGTSAWDYLVPLIQKAGLRLWCDEARVWRLSVAAAAQPGQLSLSATQTVTQAEDAVNRDGADWYDAVVITYRWTDGAGAQQVAYDAASRTGWTKALSLIYETPFPGAGAAAAVLARAFGNGNQIVTEAINDYAATPGQAFTLYLVDSPLVSGTLKSVAWKWPADEMTINSRNLLEITAQSWAFLAAGIRWQDSPVGGTWANETI